MTVSLPAPMSSDYRIEKHRTAIVVWTVEGERFSGEVFLQDGLLGRLGTETVCELLNAAEPFFPMRCDDGAIRFMSKARVAEAHVAIGPDSADAGRVGARSAMIELSIATRGSMVGCIYYEVPSARPRLLDYLNRERHQFLRVHTDDGVRLVNRDLITRIRPLD